MMRAGVSTLMGGAVCGCRQACWRRRALASVGMVAAGLVALSTGCERPLPTPAPPSATRPVAAPPGSQPVASQPTTQPATSPATQPWLISPPYVDIDALERNGRPGRVTAQIDGAVRLLLQTENVRRLTIRRSDAPLARGRSTILVLDGQVLEWLASSKINEFERSPNGLWTPVRP